METIGTKITQLRKQKALSQEELADLAKVNVRTIQRIENNETTPRGTTLKLICNALEVSPDEIVNFEKIEDYSFLIWLHLSVLIGFVLPLGNILIPLILWISNRSKVEEVDSQGKNIINFQIIFTIFLFLILSFGFLSLLFFSELETKLFSYQLSLICFLILPVFNFFFPIINAFRISKGTVKNFYPSIIRFIK